MPDEKPWDENIVYISATYNEKHPNGTKAYAMVDIGPFHAARFLRIPANEGNPAKFIEDTYDKMYALLVRTANRQVNAAIKDGRIVGLPLRKDI